MTLTTKVSTHLQLFQPKSEVKMERPLLYVKKIQLYLKAWKISMIYFHSHCASNLESHAKLNKIH